MQDEIPPYNANAFGDPVTNLYKFPASQNSITRMRRIERAVPYLVRGNPVTTKSSTQAVSVSAVSSAGVIQLASSSVNKVGSVPPNGVTGNFAATGTTSSITWYWDGTNGSALITIHRADGSYVAIPGGSITVSGLSANTTYYFLPFWSVTGGCAPGWVIGTIGSPQIAFVVADTNSASTQFYLMQQNLQNREPLTGGFMSYATPASGTNSGGGGGGGTPGNCVMQGTSIEPLGDYGEMTQGVHRDQFWRHLMTESGKQLQCTQQHPIYTCLKHQIDELNEMLKNPDENTLSKFRRDAIAAEPRFEYVATEDGVEKLEVNMPFHRWCTKRSVHLTRGHLYMANGILSHNQKMVPGV